MFKNKLIFPGNTRQFIELGYNTDTLLKLADYQETLYVP